MMKRDVVEIIIPVKSVEDLGLSPTDLEEFAFQHYRHVRDNQWRCKDFMTATGFTFILDGDGFYSYSLENNVFPVIFKIRRDEAPNGLETIRRNFWKLIRPVYEQRMNGY